MAIISSSLVIRTLSLTKLTAAYYLLTAPSALASNNLVVIFSASMGFAQTSSASLSTSSPASALAALFLAFWGFADVVAAGLPDVPYHEHWSMQVPLRLLALFSLEGYIYMFKPSGPWTGLKVQKSPLDELKSGLIFTWGFVELMAFFWVFLLLREERREAARKYAEKRSREE